MRTASILVGWKGPAAPRRVRLVAPRWILILAAAAIAMMGAAEPGRASDVEAVAEVAGLDARAIAQRAEDVLRSDATMLHARMTVESPRLGKPRVVEFQSWDDRRGDRAFIRILAPSKDKDTTFLRLPPNLWTYIPRGERSMRIPPSMLLQPWMGSDFSHDDLVNESSDVEDYDHRLIRVDEVDGGKKAYVLEYIPHEDTPVVWAKIVAWIEVEHATPLRQEFYDENDVLVRSVTFSDVRNLDGRHVPHLWTMKPMQKKGHETRIQIIEFVFDVELDDTIFTTRHLKTR